MQEIEPEVETHSKVLAWWLRKLSGYSLERVAWQPRLTIFGRVTYDCVYTLGNGDQQDPPSSVGCAS